MAHFVLSHFYLPQPCIKPRTAQFGETTSAFCMHVGPWPWPRMFLWDSWWQEPVLVSTSHLHERRVPWCCLTERFGDGQMCSCCALLQVGRGCRCLSTALSKAQLSATAWPSPAELGTGDAGDLQWHPHEFAKPLEAPGLFMPTPLLGHVGSGLAACARGTAGLPADAQLSLARFLCSDSHVSAQSYSLHAASSRIWPSSGFTPVFSFPQP